LPKPTYPGVYIEETGAAPRRIAGVSTGIPVFIGDAAGGVRAFLENGGRRHHVVPIGGGEAPAADDFRVGLKEAAAVAEADLLVLPGAALLDASDYGALVRDVLKDCAQAMRFALIEQRQGADFGKEHLGWGATYALPGGAVAGIYAATDAARGVWKAPAGLNNHTLAGGGDWKYVNVRRLAIMVERSLYEGTRWAVFEPNNSETFTLVRGITEDFLFSLWRQGALAGAKAEQAFFVRCDETTMTQDDIDMGRLNILVGIAPLKPAEFVLFRISQHAAI
jgi:phage tail sheath protein FI